MIGPRTRRPAVVSVLAANFDLREKLPNLRLIPVWRQPPPLYGLLGAESGAVLFEYPVHPHAAYFGENLPYMYFSTWHWTKMVNGYSGNVPQSYQDLAVAMDGFPEGNTVDCLQRSGVTHVTLHCALWYDEPCQSTMEKLAADPRFHRRVSARWQGQPAQLYQLAR